MRNLPAFSRFLEVAALCNTSTINYSKIANESSIPASSVQNYFEILKDTLLISELPVWQKNKRRKPASTPKFYFFDIGVVRSLQGRDLKGLLAFSEESDIKKLYLVCLEERPLVIKGVNIIPINEFLKKLWDGEIL